MNSKSLYLFYEHHGYSKYSHSLFKIDLNLAAGTGTTSTTSPVNLFPILEIPCGVNQVTKGMRCARLGSKLYFLGGTRTIFGKNEDGPYQRKDFPRDVYIFDMLTTDFKKMDACLNAGKPNPCVVFAGNGKLYALANIDISTGQQYPLFECFDPNVGKWQALSNLPPVGTSKNWSNRTFPKGVRWSGCNVLPKRQQVVLHGWSLSKFSTEHEDVTFVYHLQEDKWTCDTFWGPTRLTFQEGHDTECLYGLPSISRLPPVCIVPIKSKSDCVSIEDEESLYGSAPVDGLALMSLSGREMLVGENWADWVIDLFYRNYLHPACHFLRHLGNDYFCYVTAGMLCRPDGPDCYGEELEDPTTRCITITVFQEKKSDGGENFSFEAEILFTQDYVMKNEKFSMVAGLVDCAVVDLERVKKKLDERKDKEKKKKNKNKNKNKNKTETEF